MRQARVKTRDQIKEANKSRTEEGQNPNVNNKPNKTMGNNLLERLGKKAQLGAGMDGELGRTTGQGSKAQTKGIRSGQALETGGTTAGNKKQNMGLDL